ncbi:MipA/OmpV family protein [Gayadomonas joobiniege]|uniref:MipA/OmpV family protein n=1 Tax=Gayadomonas joobiniege TaxID=1234606 RepID=UPI000373C8DE|nr:MipA/OmpV family protein [Gayadomonas joobiniege]
MNKRFAAMACLLTVCTTAHGKTMPQQQMFGWTYGVGIGINQELYKGYERRVIPIPMIGYRGEKFDLYGPFMSYKAYQADDFAIKLTLSPRFAGFDESDSDVFIGMDEREFSFDAGLSLEYNPKPWKTRWAVKQDILGKSNGTESQLSISKSYRFGPLVVSPQAQIEYQSQNMVDYYYGVKAHEATAERPEYQPDAAYNPSIGTGFMMPGLGGMFNANVRYTWYDDQIADSPLTEKDSSFSFMLVYSRFF